MRLDQLLGTQGPHVRNLSAVTESVFSSHTVHSMLSSIGSGASHVSEVCRLARDMAKDGITLAGVSDLASLGSSGAQLKKQERDLHVYAKRGFEVPLEPYEFFVEGLNSQAECIPVKCSAVLIHEMMHAVMQSGHLGRGIHGCNEPRRPGDVLAAPRQLGALGLGQGAEQCA